MRIMKVLDKQEVKAELERVLNRTRRDYARGRFVPLSEADLVAHLYYLLLSGRMVSECSLHLDTRVVGGGGRKVDLTIGAPFKDPQAKNKRAAKPLLAMEVKFVSNDKGGAARLQILKYGPKRKEGGIRKDIRKLSGIRRGDGVYVVLLADETGYCFCPERSKDLRLVRQEARTASVSFKTLVLKNGKPGERLLLAPGSRHETGKRHSSSEVQGGILQRPV
jgi:hypothetical protein